MMRSFPLGSTLSEFHSTSLRQELNFVYESVSWRAGFNLGFPDNLILDLQLGAAGEFILSFCLSV